MYYSIKVKHFYYKHQVNSVQPQLCLIWNLILSKSTQPFPMVIWLKNYLEQARSFDIQKHSSKKSSPLFSSMCLQPLCLWKEECISVLDIFLNLRGKVLYSSIYKLGNERKVRKEYKKEKIVLGFSFSQYSNIEKRNLRKV